MPRVHLTKDLPYSAGGRARLPRLVAARPLRSITKPAFCRSCTASITSSSKKMKASGVCCPSRSPEFSGRSRTKEPGKDGRPARSPRPPWDSAVDRPLFATYREVVGLGRCGCTPGGTPVLTSIAIVIRGPGHDFPGAGVFVIVVLVLIVLIFIRVYGGGNQPGRRSAYRSRRRRSAHRANHPPAQSHPRARGESHDHRPESRHRPHRH